MRKKSLKNKIALLALFAFASAIFSPSLLLAQSDNIDVGLTVDGTPTPPPSSDDSAGGSTGVQLIRMENLSIEPLGDSVRVTWNTNIPTVSTVSWGATTNYELGSLTSTVYKTTHLAIIQGLNPFTTYHLEIVSERHGRSLVTKRSFTSTLPPDSAILPNVSNFRAMLSEGGVSLTWKNPLAASFDSVRILRSPMLSSDPLDGRIVYEGRGEEFLDVFDLLPGAYFYTAFSKGKDGSYSSGAVTSIFITASGEGRQTEDPFVGLPEAPEEIKETIADISFSDFIFSQGARELKKINDRLVISHTTPVSISIPYEKLPEVLKTIGVTLTESRTGSKFSFLLRVSEDRSAYTAVVDPSGMNGIYVASITLVDFKSRQMKTVEGRLYSLLGSVQTNPSTYQFTPLALALLWAVIIALAAVSASFFRRRNSFSVNR